jgi:hypothetical protein
LQLEDAAEAKMPKKLKAAMVAGWVLAGALAVALVCCICVLRQTPKTSEALEAGGTTEILSVHFYDGDQQEVLPEALWYDTAKIECILVQWTGETPQTVRLFYTPAGSETIEKTELLVTVAPLDGENAALISALALHRDDIYGHAYIQLDGGDESDLFNVGYDLAA